jgi:integrase
MTVQQQLMRHASIQTTMNVYGRAMPETKREARTDRSDGARRAKEADRHRLIQR